MPRVSYVDGRFARHDLAVVHVEDRGYQFADAVYEVIAFSDGRPVDGERHFDRLERSLRELRMEMPFSRRHFALKMAELARRNRIADGSLYLQVSRGAAPRDHRLPERARPVVAMTIRPFRPPPPGLVENGVAVVTVPDLRWRRPDIKSVGLLPNVLAKDEAVRAGAYEAWLRDESGAVTEGSSTNAWIVGRRGGLVTRPADGSILNGVTRLALLEVAAGLGMAVEERPFTVAEAQAAEEAFLTSTTALLVPVVRVDGRDVGDGRPGPRTRALLAAYRGRFAGAAA